MAEIDSAWRVQTFRRYRLQFGVLSPERTDKAAKADLQGGEA